MFYEKNCIAFIVAFIAHVANVSIIDTISIHILKTALTFDHIFSSMKKNPLCEEAGVINKHLTGVLAKIAVIILYNSA